MKGVTDCPYRHRRYRRRPRPTPSRSDGGQSCHPRRRISSATTARKLESEPERGSAPGTPRDSLPVSSVRTHRRHDGGQVCQQRTWRSWLSNSAKRRAARAAAEAERRLSTPWGRKCTRERTVADDVVTENRSPCPSGPGGRVGRRELTLCLSGPRAHESLISSTPTLRLRSGDVTDTWTGAPRATAAQPIGISAMEICSSSAYGIPTVTVFRQSNVAPPGVDRPDYPLSDLSAAGDSRLRSQGHWDDLYYGLPWKNSLARPT